MFVRADLLPCQLNICYNLFINLDSMSQVKPNKIANILRTSFQHIVITKTTVVPTQLFLYLIRLLKPFSKSIWQYIIEWELEKFQQYRNRKILDCNPDNLYGKNRICMKNKKMKFLKFWFCFLLSFFSAEIKKKIFHTF